MLVQVGVSVGRPTMFDPISPSLPILACGILVVGVFVALVLVALRSKENVQAGLRLTPWSITLSLKARSDSPEREKPEKPASENDAAASKP
jgi:hypothetical protein